MDKRYNCHEEFRSPNSGGDKKEAGLSGVRQENKYLAIKELHEKKQYAIDILCELAEVQRSAYYKWLRRKQSRRETEREMYYGRKYHDRETLVQAIEDYLDYYNNRRYQRKLMTLTPMEAHEVLLTA